MLFDTIAEYEEEITFVRTQMRNAVGAEKWRLNTSQSDQQVTMNMSEIRAYLTQLTTEKQALYERLNGASVTSVVPRRCF